MKEPFISPERGTGDFITSAQALAGLEVSRWGEEEVRRRLDIYGVKALLIDPEQVNIYDNGRRGFASLLATGEPVRPILNGRLTVQGSTIDDKNSITGKYTVTAEDTSGHFNVVLDEDTDKRLELNPGVRNIAIARAAADEALRRQGRKANLSIIKNVIFSNIAGVGAELDITLPKFDQLEDGAHVFEATVKKNGGENTVASLGLEYRDSAPEHVPGKTVDPEYFPELAAQMAILLIQKRMRLPNMDTIFPLYKSIKEIEILQAVKVGERVTLNITCDEIKGGFISDATLLREDGSVAQIMRGMEGKIDERQRMEKLLEKILDRDRSR